MDAEGLDEELGSFADDIGLAYEELGFPRAWGRVLGWLLVCQPDFQSAEDLATALHASKGSVSMATQALVRAGMVERQTLRGDRRTYFRLHAGAWASVIEEQTRNVIKLRELAERGLTLLNGEPGGRRRRLEELQDLMALYEQETSVLLGRWQAHGQHASGVPTNDP
jgi:DNA-binding transcriptional regulator GbsR (MarR family)